MKVALQVALLIFMVLYFGDTIVEKKKWDKVAFFVFGCVLAIGIITTLSL